MDLILGRAYLPRFPFWTPHPDFSWWHADKLARLASAQPQTANQEQPQEKPLKQANKVAAKLILFISFLLIPSLKWLPRLFLQIRTGHITVQISAFMQVATPIIAVTEVQEACMLKNISSQPVIKSVDIYGDIWWYGLVPIWELCFSMQACRPHIWLLGAVNKKS